jgi:hypothetical protein
VRTLVLTHFSQRYPDPERYRDEAAAVFSGDLVVAADLDTVPVPRRAPTWGTLSGPRRSRSPRTARWRWR